MDSPASYTIGRSEVSLVDCPRCNLHVVKLRSKSEENPRRIFFKCRNNVRNDLCYFFLWEDEYEDYLVKSKAPHEQRKKDEEQFRCSRVKKDVDNKSHGEMMKCEENQFVHERDDLKKRFEATCSLVELHFSCRPFCDYC